MAIQLTATLEQRLEHFAEQRHISADQLAQEALEAYVADYEEVLAAVKEADEQFARGEFRSHETVVEHFAARFVKV